MYRSHVKHSYHISFHLTGTSRYWADSSDLPWAHTANCFSSALRRSRWWCRNPSQQRSCCKSSESDPHPEPGYVWIPWPTLKDQPESDADLGNRYPLSWFCHVHLPFHDPNETEEQIGYSHQEVRQRQIISGVRKADLFGSVVAVEQIGLLQEALQGANGRSATKHYLFSVQLIEEHRLTPPDSRSAMCSWKMTKPRRALLGYSLHLLPTVKSSNLWWVSIFPKKKMWRGAPMSLNSKNINKVNWKKKQTAKKRSLLTII